MNLQQIQKVINEIITKYNILYSEQFIERREGEIKFIHLTLKFKVDGKEKIEES